MFFLVFFQFSSFLVYHFHLAGKVFLYQVIFLYLFFQLIEFLVNSLFFLANPVFGIVYFTVPVVYFTVVRSF